MSSIPCFLLTPTGRDARWLRRYRAGAINDCPLGPKCYHDAAVRVEDDEEKEWHCDWPHDDPRWPQRCACGYEFQEADNWQLFPLTIYRTPDGREVTLHETPPPGIETAPPGSMWFSDWCPGPKKHEGPFLWVMTPGGAWCVDGASSSGGPGWTRTGEPPNVTATPSIHVVGRYHGWLRDGALVEA